MITLRFGTQFYSTTIEGLIHFRKNVSRSDRIRSKEQSTEGFVGVYGGMKACDRIFGIDTMFFVIRLQFSCVDVVCLVLTVQVLGNINEDSELITLFKILLVVCTKKVHEEQS